jgi:hypothetical protein
MAEFLADRVQARLVLVGRTLLPAKEEWETMDESVESNKPLLRKIEQIRSLEKRGAEVLPICADIADLEQMKAAWDRVRERFGNVNGVFHTAGVQGEGVIQLKTEKEAAAVLSPKVDGTLVLDQILEKETPDFVFLFSSNLAISGNLGEVDYCAANAFLDAYAQASQAQKEYPVISADWGQWQWHTWQSKLESMMPDFIEQAAEIRRNFGITFEEGRQAVSRLLGTAWPQVMVMTQSPEAFEQRMRAIHSKERMAERADQMIENRPKHSRPGLHIVYTPPENDLERKVAEVWGDVLGIDKIGVHDPFFELGGNSLIGMVLIPKLEPILGVKIGNTAIYETPTIRAMCDKYASVESTTDTPRPQPGERGSKRKELRKKNRKRRKS